MASGISPLHIRFLYDLPVRRDSDLVVYLMLTVVVARLPLRLKAVESNGLLPLRATDGFIGKRDVAELGNMNQDQQMTTQDVLAVVSINHATRGQKLAFMGAMLDREWRVSRQLRDAYCAGFPTHVDDDEIVDQSEMEIAECASISGISDWDAVCVFT